MKDTKPVLNLAVYQGLRMLFVLKKIISGMMLPGFLIISGLLAGILCLTLTKRIKTAVACLLSALILSVVSFLPWGPEFLLRDLEQRYEPYVYKPGPCPEWILVLGQGFNGGDIPGTSRPNGAMYARLMESVRIAREFKDISMIVSLSGDFSAEFKEKWWRNFCADVQLVPKQSIILTEPKDTEEEIRQALEYIGGKPFFLVTSASHMPRAMRISVALGGKALAAPCDFQGYEDRLKYRCFIPSGRNLCKMEKAVHEYLGLAWDWLKQCTDPDRPVVPES